MNSNDENVKRGVWTPWAQVLCYDCHGNENLPNPKTDEEWARMTAPRPVADGNAITSCDNCGAHVQMDESVAYEHELVLALRERGFDAEMRQTGGMVSACGIEPSEMLKGVGGPDDISEILVTYDEGSYWMGVYDNDFSPADIGWGNVEFKSQSAVLDWAFMNQEKIAKIEPPEPERLPGERQEPMRFTVEIELHDDAISGTEMEPEDYIRQEMGWLEDSGVTLIDVTAKEDSAAHDLPGNEGMREGRETFYFSFGSSEHFPFQMGWVEVQAKDRMEACEMFSSHYPKRDDSLINCAFVYSEGEWMRAGMDEGKPGQVCHRVITDWGPHAQDFKFEYRGGVEWHIAYADEGRVSEPIAGYVQDPVSGERLLEVQSMKEAGLANGEGEFAVKQGDEITPGFESFDEALDAANRYIYRRPEQEIDRYPIHDLSGNEGIYHLGEADGKLYVANAFWSDEEPGYVNHGVFAIEGDQMEILTSGFYNGYLTIEDCVRDLASDFTPVENADIQYVADCSWEFDTVSEYREALEDGKLEAPVSVPSWQQIVDEEQRARSAFGREDTIDDLIEEARGKAAEKNAERPGGKAAQKAHETER